MALVLPSPFGAGVSYGVGRVGIDARIGAVVVVSVSTLPLHIADGSGHARGDRGDSDGDRT